MREKEINIMESVEGRMKKNNEIKTLRPERRENIDDMYVNK